MGAFLATREAAKGMVDGVHGTTFGGNPLAMAVGNACYDEISKPEFLERVNAIANHLGQALEGLKDRHPDLVVERARQGPAARPEAQRSNHKDVQAKLRERKVLVGVAGDNVLRFAPPLVIERSASQPGDRRDRRRARRADGGGRRVSAAVRHFLDIAQLSKAELRAHSRRRRIGARLRARLAEGRAGRRRPLEGHALAMIFQKNSTRTRVSFEIGHAPARRARAIVMSASDMQLGRGETVEDTARVLSRMVDAVMIRANKHQDVAGLRRRVATCR